MRNYSASSFVRFFVQLNSSFGFTHYTMSLFCGPFVIILFIHFALQILAFLYIYIYTPVFTKVVAFKIDR